MKTNCLTCIGLLMLLTSCHTQKQLEPPTTTPEHKPISGMDYSPTNLIIMYDAEIGKEPLLKAIQEIQAEVIYDYSIITGMAIRKPETMSLEATKDYFEKVNGVLSVNYDHIYHLDDPVNPKPIDR